MTAKLYPPPAEQRTGAIVLVHGAWVGEWSWIPIIPSLVASGRPVHAVPLTGHGARRHQGGPHIDLSTHVDDVVNHIENHDLVEITLVGHSYGGRVITRVSERVGDRLKSLVYLDAHAPLAPDSGQTPERAAIAEANGGMIPFAGYDPDPAMLGGEDGLAWFLERVRPQSFACISEPWQVELPASVAKNYVFATEEPGTRFGVYADEARTRPDWTLFELPGNHWLMMTHPDEVTRIILDA